MAFKGLFGGGAAVETVLHSNRVRPGGQVPGVVNVRGGHTSVVVNFIELALTAWVKVVSGSRNRVSSMDVVYHHHRITGGFQLQPNQTFQVPFALPIPWSAPFNILAGMRFPQVQNGLRAELDIAQSTDKSDVEALEVVALSSHEAILLGLARLGFLLRGSDLERPRMAFSHPGPFYQEVEFTPPDQFRDRMTGLDVRFNTDPHGLDVVLEIARRTGWGAASRPNRFRVDHATAVSQDWASVMQQHLDTIMSGGRGAVDRDAAPILRPVAHPPPAYQPPAPGYGAPFTAPPPAAINLGKKSPGLVRVTVGVGWDGAVSGAKADLDVSAVVADGNGRPLGPGYFVFYNNLRSPDGAVRHGGDTQRGEKYGDDEVIQVDLSKCPPQAQRIVLIVSTDSAGSLTFGQVRDAYIRIVNSANGGVIAKLDLDAQAPQQSAIVFGELRRTGGDWTFAAVGQGNSQGLPGILRSFGLTV